MTIKTWEVRYGEVNHSRLTLKEAMEAEIKELRAALQEAKSELEEADLAYQGYIKRIDEQKRIDLGTGINKLSGFIAVDVYLELQAERDALVAENAALKAKLEQFDYAYICKTALQGQEPDELVLTFNFGSLIKAVFQDRVLYEVDLSPKSYFQVCWAHGWSGDYESEEAARDECLSLCGYGRSIREVKPGDDGYKNPDSLELTEQRVPLI